MSGVHHLQAEPAGYAGTASESMLWTGTATTPVTFVCRVDGGAREEQALRLAASLRRWGGTLKACRVLAVIDEPRIAPRWRTLSALKSLDVTCVCDQPTTGYRWLPAARKVDALLRAEQHAETDVLVWLDSDALVLTEPACLRLSDEAMFGACAAAGGMNPRGRAEGAEGWWLRARELAGLERRKRAREADLWFDPSMFAYRRSSGFLWHYADCLRVLLETRDVLRACGVARLDHAALALAVGRLGMCYELCPSRSKLDVWEQVASEERFTRGSADALSAAQVLQYHNAMHPDAWPRLLTFIERAEPAVARWLAPYGPIDAVRWNQPRELLYATMTVYQRLRRAWLERVGW